MTPIQRGAAVYLAFKLLAADRPDLERIAHQTGLDLPTLHRLRSNVRRGSREHEASLARLRRELDAYTTGEQT